MTINCECRSLHVLKGKEAETVLHGTCLSLSSQACLATLSATFISAVVIRDPEQTAAGHPSSCELGSKQGSLCDEEDTSATPFGCCNHLM